MNSNDNNNDDEGGGQPSNNRSNNALPPNINNPRTNHSPYFSQIPGGAARTNNESSSSSTAGHAHAASSSTNRDDVNWEATAALLGGSGRSPGVAGIDRSRSAAAPPQQMDNNDTAMDIISSSPSTSQQHKEQQMIIPGMESTKPLPPIQNSRQQQQQQQQQVHHHPDLPFLVTHWIAHYDALQSSTTSNNSEDESKSDLFGSTTTLNQLSNNNKTQEQKAKEDEAKRRIQRAAADLAWSFQTLGAFGTSNTNTSSTVGRSATYSDMARKFAPLLATSTTATTVITATTTSGQNENKSVALLDSLVASSSLTTAEATKNVLENSMPCSLLEAAYEGSVPGEGSCLIDDNVSSSSLVGASQTTRNNAGSNGRRVGESASSTLDANASLEWLVPTNEASGSAMQNPVLLASNAAANNGLTAINSRNTAVQAGKTSRKYVIFRNKAIDQQKEIERTRQALTLAITRAESSGTLSSVAARRSANSPAKQSQQQQQQQQQQEFDSESDLDLHRVVAQLQRRVAELNLNYSVTQREVLDAKRKAEKACADMVSLQNRFHDPYTLNSASIGSMIKSGGARSFLHGNNNVVLPKALISQQYHGRQSQSSQLQSQLSLLKSRLSHAITMSCHLIYPVYCLRFDKTGTYFITGADDQIVKVFHLGAGPKKAPAGDDAAMTFSYGANIRGAVLVCSLRGHAGVVADIDVSSDNSLLATASGDGDVRIWGLRDGCPVAILRGHRDGANMVSWSTLSPFRLVTCGENGLARMWDVRKAALKRYGDMICDRTDYILPTRKSKSSSDQHNSEGNSEAKEDELRQNVPPIPQRADDGGTNENNLVVPPLPRGANENNLVVPPLPPGAGGIGPIGNAANAMGGIANENRVNVGDFVAGDAIDEGVEIIAQLQHGNLVNDSQLQGPGTRARRKAVKVMCLARCPIGGHFATGSDDGLGRVWADDDDARIESLDKERREVTDTRSNTEPLFIRSLTGRQQAVLGSSTGKLLLLSYL